MHPLSRLQALQEAAHERRCAALAAAVTAGHLDEDALDFTPTLMLMDIDMVGMQVWHECHSISQHMLHAATARWRNGRAEAAKGFANCVTMCPQLPSPRAALTLSHNLTHVRWPDQRHAGHAAL